MAYLDDYGTMPPAKQRHFFTQRLQNNPIDFFKELRARHPVCAVPGHEQGSRTPAVLVLKAADIRHVLDNRHFTVAPYRKEGDADPPALGKLPNFVLQTERGPRHDHARALIEYVCRPSDLERVRSLAEAEAKALLTAALPHGRLDLASQYCRHIPLRIVERYFGLPGPDASSMGEWTRGLFRWFMYTAITQYLAPEPAKANAINDTEKQAREAFSVYLRSWLKDVGQALLQGEHLAAETLLERLLRLAREQPAAFSSPLEIGVILVGLANAAVDQVNMAACNALNVLLKLSQSHNSAEVEAWQGARFAAWSNNTAALDQYIWEALRFDPPVPYLVREWSGDEPYFFADGTRIRTGTRVFLAIHAVMMDASVVKEPERFNPRRTDNPDLYFGLGPRQCLGRRLAEVQINAMVKQVLLLDGLTRTRPLCKEELFLPTSLPISFTPKLSVKAVQTPLTAVMVIKEPVAEHARALKYLVQQLGPRVAESLQKVGTVHFARFVFLENDTRFAIITTFDGSFEAYINDFIEQVGPLFNEMLQHIAQAPPTPVRKYRKEFIDYVRRVNYLPEEPFYSAYPALTVQNIMYLQQREGQP